MYRHRWIVATGTARYAATSAVVNRRARFIAHLAPGSHGELIQRLGVRLSQQAAGLPALLPSVHGCGRHTDLGSDVRSRQPSRFSQTTSLVWGR
jgi:hypothetical protein